MDDESYSFYKNMIFGHENKILQICQKFHLEGKMCFESSVTVLMMIMECQLYFSRV